MKNKKLANKQVVYKKKSHSSLIQKNDSLSIKEINCNDLEDYTRDYTKLRFKPD
jgi:hypothetical protein